MIVSRRPTINSTLVLIPVGNISNAQMSGSIIPVRSWRSTIIPLTTSSQSVPYTGTSTITSSAGSFPKQTIQLSGTTPTFQRTAVPAPKKTTFVALASPANTIPETNVYIPEINSSTVKAKIKVCPVCSKVCGNQAKLYRHLLSHREKNVECDICLKKFKYPAMVSAHKKQVHRMDLKESEPFTTCVLCKGTYKKSYMYVHMKTHTKDYKHKCDKCDRGYLAPSELNQHKLIEHEGLRYSCTSCTKTFKSKEVFKDHLEWHNEKDKQYKCDLCDKVILSKQSFERHQRYHSKKKVCELCGKVLASSVTYAAHMNMHNGARPYICDVCEKGFRGKRQLQIHQRIHTQEKPYTCKLCHKSFNQFNTLTVHMRGHTGVKPYACDLCQKRFVTNTLLKYHRRKHEND